MTSPKIYEPPEDDGVTPDHALHTRFMLNALVQLLIEKGVLSSTEFDRKLAAVEDEPGEDDEELDDFMK